MNPGTTSQTVHIHRPSSPPARQAGPWSVEAVQQLLGVQAARRVGAAAEHQNAHAVMRQALGGQ